MCVTHNNRVNDTFSSFAPGSMERNTATFLHAWDDEPGKLT